MLKRIRIENYRSIGEVDIELGPLTVLVGQNGSGKTNFVDAIHFLCDALTYGLDAAVMRRGGLKTLRRWSPHRPRNVAFEVEVGSEDGAVQAHYTLALRSEAAGEYSVKREALTATAWDATTEFEALDGKVVHSSLDPKFGKPEGRPGLLLAPLWPDLPCSLFTSNMRNMGFYSIFPDALREPQSPGMDHPLDTHGHNLTSVLRKVQRDAPASLAQVRKALAALLPRVRDIQIAGVGGYEYVKFQHEGPDARRHWLDSKQMSDGTLRMLGILTALYQEPALSLVAIEEPELTIHPGMLAVLRDVIVEASQKRSQVIITTHSPDLMNLFDVDVLRVVEMTAEGTKIGPVAQHQREAVRENLFLPGELARMEGLARAQ